MDEIVSHYDEDDQQFAQWADEKIKAFFASMPPSTSKQDPNRLGTQSVMYSRIKSRILDIVGPMDVTGRETGMKEFNAMDSLKEQLKFQAKARNDDTHPWVQNLGILPNNLRSFKMPDVSAKRLKQASEKSNRAKLREETEEIDGDRLMEKLMPFLTEGKRNARAAALLLATGRRTTEVLLSGDLYLDEKHTMDGFFCMFTGQLKAGLDGDEPYEIPLLAPYYVVKAAWDKVRELFPTEGMTEIQVNANYGKTIHQFTSRCVGLNPHTLRACYALMTFLLREKKMSLIGHIGMVLGHSGPKASSHYQTLEIVNFSGPWPAAKFEAPEPLEEEEVTKEDMHGWDLQGRPETKRLPGLLQMQEKRIKITATSIRSHAGGTMGVAQRILERNAALIEKYNASL
jgi:hypothetical protein